MPRTARLHILGSDTPSRAAIAESSTFGGWDSRIISQCIQAAKLDPADIEYSHLTPNTLFHLNDNPNLRVVVPLGERAMRAITNYKSLEKYQLSPLNTSGLKCPKAVASYSPNQLRAQYNLKLYLTMALARAKEGMAYAGPWKRKKQNFIINPNYRDALDILTEIGTQEHLAVDFECGAGIINTVGFAWSGSDALAIGTRPEAYSEIEHHILWNKIACLLEKPSIKKILQNNIFEDMYCSKYGIRLKNVWHDTMWAQRVLWPEFKVGLGNVGRMYTSEVYWKDDGKSEASEDKKDWHNIKDWQRHYEYNCKDTSNTYEAAFNQRTDLARRGMSKFFYDYVMKLAPPISEMCSRGLPVDEAKRMQLETDTQKDIDELIQGISTPINHRSFKQKMELFRDKGYNIPKKRKSDGTFRESVDELSLKKMRLKYPEDQDIKILLKTAKLEKALSSYIKFNYHKDGNVRFMINGCGTETLRFSSSLDPWDGGFNAQTIPSEFKCIFPAPSGFTWVNVDLKQAESRYVAYACGDTGLIEMLENPSKDVHKFVASHIFNIPEDEVKYEQRQLGKKSGHGANYSMAATTFMESCLKEMDLVLTKKEAQNVLDTYHRLFPGIQMGQEKTRALLRERGWLENPFGYRRYFYGRLDDNTFREAYAFEPQSSIPMITNYLMLHLLGRRDAGKLNFRLHLQVHDSLLMLCKVGNETALMDECLDTDAWHPRVELAAGRLIIPTETASGNELNKLTEYTG